MLFYDLSFFSQQCHKIYESGSFQYNQAFVVFVNGAPSSESRIGALYFPGRCPHAVKKLNAVRSQSAICKQHKAHAFPLCLTSQTLLQCNVLCTALCRGLWSLLLSVQGQTAQQLF